jgi:2-polyprenyl-3-methyl-5-hydroxy-6-metoxy-1,4-benzoquinol methylase
MRDEASSSFSKYMKKGAYHWRELSRLPWRHNSVTAARYAIVREAVKAAGSGRVLDVGCGDAALTYLLARDGCDVTGMEPEKTGRELAQAQLRRFGMAEIEIVPSMEKIPPGVFDVVVCSEVIEHVAEPQRLLFEMEKMLRPGGTLVLTTPVRLTAEPLDIEHVIEFFPAELAKLVSANFIINDHRFEVPVFGVELLSWRPRWCLSLPITKWAVNIASAWFGRHALRSMAGISRYPTLQTIIASREASTGSER